MADRAKFQDSCFVSTMLVYTVKIMFTAKQKRMPHFQKQNPASVFQAKSTSSLLWLIENCI
eukprot:886680-Pelagomonas_calceolata.AAC.1